MKPVTSLADSCGEWEEVTSLPDLEIEYVTSFPRLSEVRELRLSRR